MKKIVVIASVLAVFAVVLGCVFIGNVTIYNAAGETKTVKEWQTDKYRNEGWYTEPVRLMYNAEGEVICIYEAETEKYEAQNWYTEPVTLMYAAENREKYVKESEIEEHKNNGWYTEPLRAVYSDEGMEMFVPLSEAEAYINDGWSYEPPTREGLTDLKSELEIYIKPQSGDWGIYVKSLKTNEFLSINEKPYSSASLIKLFNMAAVYQKLSEGTLEFSDGVKNELEQMITESSNSAFNALTKRLGNGNTSKGFAYENNVTKIMGCNNTQHKSELIDETMHRKAYFEGFNQTSPRDCGAVLEFIYRKKLVSEAASTEMLDLLSRQTRTWKIPASLPEGTKTANKTGENDDVQGDAAIVFSPACDYIICVIGNGRVDSGVNTIQTVSKMTYDYFNG